MTGSSVAHMEIESGSGVEEHAVDFFNALVAHTHSVDQLDEISNIKTSLCSRASFEY